MTPTEKDAMALAAVMYAAHAEQYVGTSLYPLQAWEGLDESSRQHWAVVAIAARAHLASRIAELEETREVLFGGLDRDRDNITTRNLAVVAINALARERDRATRAEAELAAVREDAERYRWLVESNWPEIFYYHDGEHHKHYHDSRSAVAQLSAAIDAARGGE